MLRKPKFVWNFCGVHAAGEGSRGGATCQPATEIPYGVWIIIALSPLLVGLLSEVTKRVDRRLLENEFDNRRFMFDTRLGCYSPK